MEEDKVLLDYYTKRMATHAMITIAVVFGLFSLLWIISAFPLRTFAFCLMTKIGLTIGFIMLTLFGMYEIKTLQAL